MSDVTQENFDVIVIGGGPAGIAAAYRCQDGGMSTLLINQYEDLGGVCLNVGCIPSKALLGVAKTLSDAKAVENNGILFEEPSIDLEALKASVTESVDKLSMGLSMLGKKRRVRSVVGRASFHDAFTLDVHGDEPMQVKFKHAIIATGSKPNRPDFLPSDDRIFDSTGALKLEKTDGVMVVIGGGIIGCEMATIYNALGCEVVVLEYFDRIMVEADAQHAEICKKAMTAAGIQFVTSAKVASVECADQIVVSYELAGQVEEIQCDQILYAVGRHPYTEGLGLENVGVVVENGFVVVDEYLRTNIDHVYAIGDVAKTAFDNAMLAHRSSAHGHVVSEVIAGKNIRYDHVCMPSVSYTDPEVAWVGKQEEHLKKSGQTYQVGKFPWAACGRAVATHHTNGHTKVFADEEGYIIGASIVGRDAGELIGVYCLAIEMGATLTDLSLTIMPHPTLVETTKQACEVALGVSTDQ
ncbi:dihydrolipoyl dehydrogenase [Gammaproteobacteria bacterium]|nr:dihydrolipoyl dehydrogenase [Gammaproteobacteria bacterium]